MATAPQAVHATLARTMLADGLPVVFDPERSKGARFYDAVSRRHFLDCFGFFGSLPLGYNHPRLSDPEWIEHLGRWAVHKTSNSDIYSVPMADFVRTFEELAQPRDFTHLFLVSGGTLAVENALKAAFDWKTRFHRARGRSLEAELVVHLQDSFHGRSGYCLSLTNTDPVKTDLFPKFRWPRVSNPYCRFPLEGENLSGTQAREERSLAEIRSVLEAQADAVAAIVLEPIQCEGGDHHLRGEYLAGLRALADRYDVLLIYDEVQTGFGSTGRMWCYQHFGVAPDIVAFGKKAQVCGIMAGRRIDLVPDNVFKIKSRINSTWGGDLVDMIRATRILEVYRDEKVLENATERGQELRAGLERIARSHPDKVANPRGRGLIAALEVLGGKRQRFLARAFEEGLLCLSCGPTSVRLRPALDIDAASVAEVLAVLDRVAATL